MSIALLGASFCIKRTGCPRVTSVQNGQVVAILIHIRILDIDGRVSIKIACGAANTCRTSRPRNTVEQVLRVYGAQWSVTEHLLHSNDFRTVRLEQPKCASIIPGNNVRP